ncbi:MAG: SprB repeat-containing protein, partial [Flavobacteriales bacterium]
LWTPAPPAGQNTTTASQLCPGNWSVTITDGAGCDTTVQFTIAAPPPIVPNASRTDVTCAGACDGTATAPATGGTGAFTYNWQPGNPAGDGTSAVSGLCAGNWSVIITDGNGCDTTVQFLIIEPLPLSLTGSQTNVTCGATCDGSATVVVAGGTPGYTYVWSPAPPQGQGSATASQLCAGTWSVTITDANGCDVVRNFTILPAIPIVATVQITPISCANVCDGTATGVVSGGAPPYTYLWAPAPAGGQGSLTATGLCEGPGTFTISDSLGCDTTIAFNITAPPPIQVASTVTDASCSGNCDGSIVLLATGGTGPFNYAWTPASAGTSASAVNLCPGPYQVVVSSGGCDTTLNFTIAQPPAIDVNLAFTAANCANACDGTATLTGDLAVLSFVWTPEPGAGQGTASVTGLCPGSNTVTVTNAAGCDTLIAFTINAPDPLLPDLQITDASCGTACDGAAVLNVSGGTPGYTYLWTPEPGTGQGTSTAGALCPGDYEVTITDAAGCDTTVQFTIARPSGIVASGSVTPAGCADLCDGKVVITATGGVEPYTYSWTPQPGLGQGTGIVTELCPGTWTVTIGDQAGCDTTLVFNVGSPDAIDPHGVFTNESCNGPCDGRATVAPTGGSGAFTYAWSPVPPIGAGTASVAGLCAGDWCVTVTDLSGCDTTWCFTILPSSPITATLSTVDGGCWNECTGLATVTASGGVGNFSYLWIPEPATGQGTANATGLCQGPGTVTVTDQAGCDTTLTFLIFKNPPIQPNLTVYPESCTAPCTGEAGVAPVGGSGTYSYLWQPEPGSGTATTSDAVGLCAGVNYTVTITDGNGCDTTVAFTVPVFVPIGPVLVLSPANCSNTCDGSATVSSVAGGIAPYSYFWEPTPANGQGSSQASGLCPGSYEVTVGDANGCDTTLTFVITAPAPIDPDATITPIGCGGQCTGAITLAPQGGNGGFTYTWTPAPLQGQGTATASQLCAGDWTVVIADVNGCDTTLTFTLLQPLPIDASADVTPSHCGVCDGAAQLHVSGGNAPYSFFWGPPLNINTTDSLQIGLCAGVYPVVVTDASGCGVQLVVAVGDDDGEVITMTDGVTSCPAVCDGTVSVAFNCSAGPCTVDWYDLQGNDLGQSDVVTGLCAGSYLAVVTNANGCITIDTAFVTEPAPLTANISSTPASCPNLCDGTATIGVVGGVGPFDYAWSPLPGGGPNAPQATGLCPGPYEIFVHDQGGCDATFNVLITAPAPITAGAAVTDISCSGQCDGAITISGQGGT